MSQQLTVRSLFEREDIQQRFEKMLGERANGFVSSVIQVVSQSKQLAIVDQSTVLSAAAMAAVLDLPVTPSLGMAYIVPYKGRAQFQIGWKGLVQLAHRTGQYQKINAIEVYENQFKMYNTLTEELEADFSSEGAGKVVGYVAYFRLKNGFEKLVYWSKEKVDRHAKKYSQSYRKGYGSVWNDGESGFDAMAKKTVLKNAISKWGILSIEMQKAIVNDQAVVDQDGNPDYVDNKTIDVQAVSEQEEKERILSFIEKATNNDELELVLGSLDSEQLKAVSEAIENKKESFKTTTNE